MKLLRTKVWSVLDIGLLKWSCILFGTVIGSYLSSFIKRHVWIIAGAALLFAAKPTVSYFSGNDEKT